MILDKIGDIHRFPMPHQLFKYFWLGSICPSVRKLNISHTKITKRGSKALSNSPVESFIEVTFFTKFKLDFS